MSVSTRMVSPVLLVSLIIVFFAAVAETAYQVGEGTQVSTSPADTVTMTPRLNNSLVASLGAVYSSVAAHLSFSYPSQSSYSETELLQERARNGLKTTGHQITFTDKLKLNPSFEATSSDFTAEDSIPHDMLVGTLENKNSFSISAYSKVGMLTTEVAPGMFQATAYSNLECSPGVASYLFVRPPQGSNLKIH